MESIYGTVAGLDVHKKTVVVVVLQSSQPNQDLRFSSNTGHPRGYGVYSSVLAAGVDGLGKRIYADIGASALDTSAAWP